MDAKIPSGLNNIIQSSYSKKEVSQEEQKAQVQDRFLRGRHIAFMIYEYFDNQVPRAEKVGDVIAADHKVLREDESRTHHRYAVVVQDLALFCAAGTS